MSHPLRDLTGHQFGELTVVERVGTKVYPARRNRPRMTSPLWGVTCHVGHSDSRSSASLKISGDEAKCKECWKGRHY